MDANIFSKTPASSSPRVLSDLVSKHVHPAAEPFLLLPDRSWSYGEFSDAVDAFAAGLVAAGISKGDRIAIAAPNSAEWLITWFAAVKLGAILVTLNVAYREREFTYMLNQSRAVMLICSDDDSGFDFVEFLAGLRPRLATVQHYVFLGGNGLPGSRQWQDLASAGRDTRILLQAETPSPNDLAVILYTSGTTGDPKGATLTHGSILASAAAQAEHLGHTREDVAIGHMPLNHVGGMTCTVAAMMMQGGKVALLPRYSPAQGLAAIVRHKVSILIGVPTMYTLMLDLPSFTVADTSSVRLCVIGGTNVEPALGRRILKTFKGARMANLFGLSETSGGCIISAADDDLETLVATLGIPIGKFEIRIADDQHRSLPLGVAGELLVRGGCVARGYWASPDESAGSFLRDGWLATGDIARETPEGRIALCGRKKEMYVRSGYNVYPVEVENVLARDPSVAMSAVIGVSDDLLGEVGHAFVVPAAGCTIDAGKLLQRCREELARYKVPDKVHIVSNLPLTPSGKIKKAALRAELANTELD